ncbi:MAG: hypothetical protein GQ477_01770 [Nanohaloarchaea archaeon]|nr:hypothetical protein [Candidatus Nanohaloarchaea archaeon]
MVSERLVNAVLIFFILSGLWYMPSAVFSTVLENPVNDNSITSNVLVFKENDHENYWMTNKEDIKTQFNPYLEQFNQEGCIDHPELRNLLVVGNEVEAAADNTSIYSGTDIENAYRLHKLVYDSIEYAYIDDKLTSEEILVAGRGDCSEKSVLLASLLDAAGVDAYVFDNGAHWYVFANIEGAWMPIDPSVYDFYYVYKNWDNEDINKHYLAYEQAFIFNRDEVVFNKDWCSNKIYV